MSFKSQTLAASVSVTLPGGPQSVRGLSLHDIMGLVERHRPALTAAFAELAGQTDAVLKSSAAMGGAVLEAMPDLAVEIILIGSDVEPTPEEVGYVSKMGASSQLALLEKIAEQTFAMEGGAGKVVGIVIKAVRGTASLVKGLGQSNPTI